MNTYTDTRSFFNELFAWITLAMLIAMADVYALAHYPSRDIMMLAAFAAFLTIGMAFVQSGKAAGLASISLICASAFGFFSGDPFKLAAHSDLMYAVSFLTPLVLCLVTAFGVMATINGRFKNEEYGDMPWPMCRALLILSALLVLLMAWSMRPGISLFMFAPAAVLILSRFIMRFADGSLVPPKVNVAKPESA